MNASSFISVFPRQLRFWTFHCIVNAAPSFVIALLCLDLARNLPAILAMCCGIISFILLYATLTSLPGPFSNQGNILSRSLRTGAKVRSAIAGLALICAFTPALMISPDFWSGNFAIGFTNSIIRHLDPSFYGLEFGGRASFFQIYLTTVIEGFILSILLLVIAFFAVIVLQSKERRKFLRSARNHGEAVH